MPGPELPLVDYWSEDVFRVNDIDVREIPANIYRAIIRCYAIELFPIEVTSYHQWRMLLVNVFDPAVLNHSITRGARWRVKGEQLRFDPWAALKIDAWPRKGISVHRNIQAPALRLCRSLWDSDFYSSHSPEPLFSTDEIRLYQNKCVRVQVRLKSLGVITKYNKLLSYRARDDLSMPLISKAFEKPFPGAIVHVFGEPGWVVREVDGNAVVVEFEHGDEFEEEVVLVGDLEVLG